MKPTRADLAFWQVKTTPKWAAKLTPVSPGSIDSAINSHAPKEPRRLCAHNTIALISLTQSNRRREGKPHAISDCLAEFVANKCRIRQHYAARWLRKLARSKS